MATDCPSDEALSLINGGAMGDAQRRELMSHVEECAACWRTVAALARLSAGPADPQIPARYRVLRESRAVARLSHRNVIAIHDVVVEAGWGFISMESLDGGTLATWLEQDHSFTEVLDVFEQAARGLAAAHRAGVVHRDFKPANVLRASDGRVCVSDFGLARVEGDPTLSTLGGDLIGTPAYMAPEQFDRQPLTAATDQFSFFVALHEALGRSRPFEGASLESARRAVQEGRRRPPAREIPGPVLGLIDRGLQRDPEARFPSMDVVADELARLRTTRSRSSRPLLAFATLVAIGAIGLTARFIQRPLACPPLTGRGTVWTTTQRDAVSQALASDPATMKAVVQALDQTAVALDDAWAASCVGDRPVAQRAREQLCLADTLAQLEAASQTLSAIPPEVAPRALPVVRTLPEPKACANLEALSERRPSPSTEPARTLAREGRVLMLESEALRRLSRYPEALARVHQAKARAEAAHDRWLIADALRLEGRLQNNIGDYPGAEKVLDAAVEAARATGDDVLLGRVAFAQAFVECLNQHHAEHCDAAVRLLEDAAARRPLEELRASLAEVRSARAGLRHDVTGTIDELKVALALWQRVPQSTEDQLRSRVSLVLALIDDLRPGEAVAELTALQTEAAAFWGPNHARVVQLETLGPSLLIAQGKLDEAELASTAARQRVTTYLGPTSAEEADALGVYSTLLELRGRPVEALEVLRHAEQLRPELSFRSASAGLLSRLGKKKELAELRKELEVELNWRQRPPARDDVFLIPLLDTCEDDPKTFGELLAWSEPLLDRERLTATHVLLSTRATEFALRQGDWKAAGAHLATAKAAMKGRTDETIAGILEELEGRLALAANDFTSAETLARTAVARAEQQGRRDSNVGLAHVLLGQVLSRVGRRAEACHHLRVANAMLEPYALEQRTAVKAALTSCDARSP